LPFMIRLGTPEGRLSWTGCIRFITVRRWGRSGAGWPASQGFCRVCSLSPAACAGATSVGRDGRRQADGWLRRGGF